MRQDELHISTPGNPLLTLLDLSEVPELPHPPQAPQFESIVAHPLMSAPARTPRLDFALDSAIVAVVTLLAATALYAFSPSTMPQDLPAPLAGIGFALFELAFTQSASVWLFLFVAFGCAVACALACGRTVLLRFRQANAPRRLIVGPPLEVASFVGANLPLTDATALAPQAPRSVGAQAKNLAVTLPELVLSRPTDEVVLLRGWRSRGRCEQAFRDCEMVGVDVAVELESDQPITRRGKSIEGGGERRFARYTFVPRSGLGPRLKWALEYAMALLLTLLALPVMAVIALAIKFTSDGPVVFRQWRTGLNGRRIPCFKFRTMVVGAHAAQRDLAAVNQIKGSALLFKMDNDPRVTPIGRFLRRTSLDELPQLFNVLRGELTLIGPRLLSIPLARYQPAHRRRLSVRPGIACAWQAWHRGETDFNAWMRSDLDYLDNWSLYRDLKILLRTAWVVLRREGAR